MQNWHFSCDGVQEFTYITLRILKHRRKMSKSELSLLTFKVLKLLLLGLSVTNLLKRLICVLLHLTKYFPDIKEIDIFVIPVPSPNFWILLFKVLRHQ